MQQHAQHLPLFLTALCLLGACTVPEISNPILGEGQETEDGGSDEFGAANDDEAGGETGGGAQGAERPPNSCLTQPHNGEYGYRHHCGGNIEFRLSGMAEGQLIDRLYDYGFGPGYAKGAIAGLDTYESPMVASCCGGPYDFDTPPLDQKVYFENCKLDAVQQMCAAAGQWLIVLADQYPLAKNKLLEAAATIGDQETQTECVLSLYEAGLLDEQGEPVLGMSYNKIDDTEWEILGNGASLKIEIDLLEILSLEYPDPPATCESIFENDTSLLPLLEAMGEGGDGEVQPLLSASLAITDGVQFYQQVTAQTGALYVDDSPSGAQLNSLNLRSSVPTTANIGTAPIVIDEWSLSLLGMASGSHVRDATVFDAGTVTFSLSFVEDQALRRVAGTNAEPFTLRRSSTGRWLLDNLVLTLEEPSGTWSMYTSGPLEFGQPER